MDLLEWLYDNMEGFIYLITFGVESGYFFWEIVFIICLYLIISWYESIPTKTEED